MITVAVTADELHAIRQRAFASGWSVRAYLVRTALAPRSGPTDGVSADERADLTVGFLGALRELSGIANNLNQVAARINRVLVDAPPGAVSGGKAREVIMAASRIPQVAEELLEVGSLVRDALVALQRRRR